ncbi:MAG: glycosyltransferase [candidate division Zixibacteria bacterium]|nr:glycosyltransferase [candidate division Zixibacteria bacterium]
MSGRKKVVFFCDQWRRTEFLNPFVAALSREEGWEIIWETARDAATVQEHARNADFLWFDRFDQSVVTASQTVDPGQAKVICRISGTEFFQADINQCRWEFFDHLVAALPATLDILRNKFSRLDSYCATHLIPAVVDPGDFNVTNKQRTARIAYVGRISPAVNSQLLLQCVAALSRRSGDYRLSIVGQFDNLSTRFYFEHLLSRLNLGDKIRFEPEPSDWESWYSDKSYFLSTATQAGQEAYILQAMAAGLKPLVHDYFGAEEYFPPECRYGSVDELCELLQEENEESWQPERYRSLVVDKHNIHLQFPIFLKLFAEKKTQEETPRVSILLPTYNRAPLLRRALDNMEKQNYPNLEIVVADDCSTDDTPEVIKSQLERQKNLISLRNEKNLGPCQNIGEAFKKATGDYVIVCSDDDLLDQDAIARYVEVAQRKNADVVYSDLAIIDDAGKEKTVWQYRNYYDDFDLLRDLIFSGCNRIPESFLCRRDLFEPLYLETYGKRFLNTFFLPLLRQVRMVHLPRPVYKYTVAQQSTFNTVAGLFDRVKSTQNYINSALFMYSPLRIFQIDSNQPPSDQLALAYYNAAGILARLGSGFIEGQFYTGVSYRREDKLYQAYFYSAYHWLKLAQKYGLHHSHYIELEKLISAAGDPLDFDPVTSLKVPLVYRRLPWFAFRPYNTVTDFVALDICSIGAPDWLCESEYEIYRDERITVAVCNHLAKSGEEFTEVVSNNVITAINLFDEGSIKQIIQYLIDNHLFSVHLLNFTRVKIPELELLKNIHNVAGQTCDSFDEYLDLLTRVTAVCHESALLSTIS